MARGTAQSEGEPREGDVEISADYSHLDPALQKKIAANSQKVKHNKKIDLIIELLQINSFSII